MVWYFERDFGKRKTVFLGICLKADPARVVGIAEMFAYEKDVNRVTVGYRLSEAFRSRGIAAKAVKMMADYLFHTVDINRIRVFVMPENASSCLMLLRNGFTKEGTIRRGHVWTGRGVVDLTVYSLLRSEWKAQQTPAAQQ
jgi:[ribosomal protein S5]-alanine N-acetyltransferase